MLDCGVLRGVIDKQLPRWAPPTLNKLENVCVRVQHTAFVVVGVEVFAAVGAEVPGLVVLEGVGCVGCVGNDRWGV